MPHVPLSVGEVSIVTHCLMGDVPRKDRVRVASYTAPPPGIFHCKALLVEFESGMLRVAVGSGNLFEAWDSVRDLWWVQDFRVKPHRAPRSTGESGSGSRAGAGAGAGGDAGAGAGASSGGASASGEDSGGATRAPQLLVVPDFEAYLLDFLTHLVREGGKADEPTAPRARIREDVIRPWTKRVRNYDFSGARATLVGSWRGGGALKKRGRLHTHGHMRLRHVLSSLGRWGGKPTSPVLTISASMGNMQPKWLYVVAPVRGCSRCTVGGGACAHQPDTCVRACVRVWVSQRVCVPVDVWASGGPAVVC